MQELVQTNNQGETKKKNYSLPEELPGITVAVKRNLKLKAVVLEVGTNFVVLTVQGARDLALALRQNANFVERHA